MKRNAISLNGMWYADYLSETPYTQTIEPAVCLSSNPVMKISVPGYWEDMTGLFQAIQKKMNLTQ